MTNAHHIKSCILLMTFLEKYVSKDQRLSALTGMRDFLNEFKEGVLEEIAHPLTGLHREEIARIEKMKAEEWSAHTPPDTEHSLTFPSSL